MIVVGAADTEAEMIVDAVDMIAAGIATVVVVGMIAVAAAGEIADAVVVARAAIANGAASDVNHPSPWAQSKYETKTRLTRRVFYF